MFTAESFILFFATLRRILQKRKLSGDNHVNDFFNVVFRRIKRRNGKVLLTKNHGKFRTTENKGVDFLAIHHVIYDAIVFLPNIFPDDAMLKLILNMPAYIAAICIMPIKSV